MNAAIISTGPSMPRELDVTGYDVSIGVNSAGLHHAVDWLVVADGVTFGDVDNPNLPPRLFDPITGQCRIQGDPKFFIHYHALSWLTKNRADIANYLKSCYVMYWPSRDPSIRFSGVGAFVLADILGCKKIDAYGVDMAGDTGYDGTRNEACRTDARWAWEKARIKEITCHAELTYVGI